MNVGLVSFSWHRFVVCVIMNHNNMNDVPIIYKIIYSSTNDIRQGLARSVIIVIVIVIIVIVVDVFTRALFVAVNVNETSLKQSINNFIRTCWC